MALGNLAIIRHIHNWDVATFVRVQFRVSRSRIVRLARAISYTADGWPYAVAALCFYLLSPINGGPFVEALALAFLVERSLYWIMKNGFKRRRPPEALPDFTSVIKASDEFSFPSGHTSGAFLVTTACVLTFGVSAFPMVLWAMSVAMSRIILGVHFPTDTAMGALIGTSVAYAAGFQAIY